MKKIVEKFDKSEHPLESGYVRVRCPCNYYVDYKLEDLELLKGKFPSGTLCPNCGRIMGWPY